MSIESIKQKIADAERRAVELEIEANKASLLFSETEAALESARQNWEHAMRAAMDTQKELYELQIQLDWLLADEHH